MHFACKARIKCESEGQNCSQVCETGRENAKKLVSNCREKRGEQPESDFSFQTATQTKINFREVVTIGKEDSCCCHAPLICAEYSTKGTANDQVRSYALLFERKEAGVPAGPITDSAWRCHS